MSDYPLMSTIRWLYRSVLQRLGWWRNFKLVFLGLDNSGKTTLLQMLKDDRLGQQEPTGQPTSEELRVAGRDFQTFDVGGHAAARRLWRDYLLAVDGIIFLVDCADRGRLAEAKAELDSLLAMEADMPVLILGNKIDLPEALSEHGLREALGLRAEALYLRPVALFMCSVVKRQGYGEGFMWLIQNIHHE